MIARALVRSTVSGLALATALSASSTYAACSPNPPLTQKMTTCTGLSNGLTIQADQTQVIVASGAQIVAAPSDPAAIRMLPVAALSSYYQTTEAVTVNGSVAGGTLPGILIENPQGSSVAMQAGILVGTGASISGSTGIRLSPAAVAGTFVSASVVNFGSITASAGAALIAADFNKDIFTSIENETTGFIGGIDGNVATLVNAGVIDGGSSSAYRAPSVASTSFSIGQITNLATIRSASTAATIQAPVSGSSITNSGRIANAGSGAAISGASITLTNQAGGTISSTGTSAVAATGFLNLTNRGIITGSVSVVSNPGSSAGSLIDSTGGGGIFGNVTLGDGNDTVVTGYANGNFASGISGRIDPGGGTNLLRVALAASTTVTALTVPNSFQQLQFALSNNATVTLSQGFDPGIGLSFGGTGTLVNATNLTGSGPILSHYFTDPSGLADSVNLINSGTVSTVLTGNDYAVRFFSALAFTNNGTISSTGGTGGVNLSLDRSFTNNGTISADGVGVNVFGFSITNTGTIHSNTGTGLSLQGSVSSDISLNSGTISGQLVGVDLDKKLSNAGTISSPAMAALLRSYGSIYNQASGLISGATAIGHAADVGYTTSSVVTNAGTINGNVDFGLFPQPQYGTSNTFFALPGGVLNGNLKLGSGYDIFVTSFENEGTGQYAGVTGLLSGSGIETVRYRVTADSSGAIAAPGIFSILGYDVSNNASLTLTAPAAPLAVPLLLSGIGTIDLTADVTTSGQSAIQVAAPLVIPGSGQTGTSSHLTIVNHGTLTASSTNTATASAVSLMSGDSFTNAGTIRVSGPASPVNPSTSEAAGIMGGATVTNGGSIVVDAAAAINGAPVIINSGTIGQIDGSTTGRGIVNAYQVTNSGTITTKGTAIALSFGLDRIDNSGTISSAGDIAITGPGGYAIDSYTLTNDTGGTISGGTGKAAIMLGAGWKLYNSGTINGDVKLGQDSGSLPSTYDGAAGTLNGNLTFGSGNDVLVVENGLTGVTGQIDGGAGTDTVVRRQTTSGTVTLGGPLPTNFEVETVEALGADTTVTVTGPATALTKPLAYYGDGTIISQINEQATSSGTNIVILNGRIDGGTGILAFTNQGTLGDGLRGTARSLTNSGTITTAGFGTYAVVLGPIYAQPDSQTISVTNSGTISATGAYSSIALQAAVNRYTPGNATPDVAQSSITIVNSGTIASSGSIDGGLYGPFFSHDALFLSGDDTTAVSVTNSGIISTTDPASAAISAVAGTGATFTLVNSGQITGGSANTGSSAAILVSNATATITNSGTITGSIRLSTGGDVIENRGAIAGDVYMGAGNDTFLQLAGTVTGIVDGGTGLDTVVIDTANSTNVDASHFINFERFTQTGSGNATYNGNFSAQNFGMAGGSLTVAQGSSLTSGDAVTISGSDTMEQVTNLGTISGSVSLGGGNDSVVNRGTIGGAVLLGDGDDSFTEGPGSTVAGGVDGGSGTNTYIVDLAGDRTGIGQRTNFQTLGVTGTGTLTLTLDQSWQHILLAGNNLNLSLAGFTAAVMGGDAAEQVVADGDLTSVSLGGGNDLLSLRTTTLAGQYDGGTGSNLLRTTGSGPVTLSGSVANFGQLDIAGGALAITGSLTNTQGPTVLTGSSHLVSIERGATVSGGLTLGGGGNTLRIDAGSTVSGAIVGGDGSAPSTLQIANAGGTMNIGGNYSGFATTSVMGGGTVQLNGAITTGAMTFDGNFAIAPNAVLSASTVTGSAGDNVFTVSGSFAGALDLGAGNDTLRLTGTPLFGGSASGGGGTNMVELAVSGSDTAPTNLGTASFTGFQTLRTTAGVAIMGGSYIFDTIQIGAGSRLIGAAGSTFTAPQINVAVGGTFGSAGTVNGNIAVAGTLSPGASPGTMTVNGNVALAAGSTSLFEIGSAVSDKLLVSGTLAIASGSTLTLTGSRPLTPGVTLDLIVANGGITGAFSTVNQPSSIGGFLSQSANRISLLGTFMTSSSFTPQVNLAIQGVNTLLIAGASSAVIAAVPKLLAGGAADPAAFARISPEPFASAMELGIEDGLSLVDTTRNQARSAPTKTGLYSFGQALGYSYHARGDGAEGINGSHLSSTGGYAGIGFGNGQASIGAFVGYGDSHQRIDALGSRLSGNGVMAGIQGEASFAGLKIAGLIAYDERHLKLDRATPQGGTVSDFTLRTTIGDVTLRYALPVGLGWTIQPRVGASYVLTSHGAIGENGPSPFTLLLGHDRLDRWFVDGGLDLAAKLGPVRAFAGIGLRHRLHDEDNVVVATFTGSTAPITALGLRPERNAVLGTVGAAIDLTPRIALSAGYTGAFAHTARHSGTIGLRWTM